MHPILNLWIFLNKFMEISYSLKIDTIKFIDFYSVLIIIKLFFINGRRRMPILNAQQTKSYLKIMLNHLFYYINFYKFKI